MSPTRAGLWQKYGPPTDQEGSANEPRTRQEYGVTWNEKWIYRGANGRAIERVVLFLRYDPVAVIRIRPDAGAEHVWLLDPASARAGEESP